MLEKILCIFFFIKISMVNNSVEKERAKHVRLTLKGFWKNTESLIVLEMNAKDLDAREGSCNGEGQLRILREVWVNIPPLSPPP